MIELPDTGYSWRDFDLVVSYSRIRTYRVCSQQAYYKYDKKIEPKKKKYELAQGDVVHGGLESHSKGEDWREAIIPFERKYQQMFEEERAEGVDLIENSKKIIRGYIRRWKDQPLKYLLVEPEIGPIPFTKFKGLYIGFFFKPDGIVEDIEGYRWLLERKVRKKLGDPGMSLWDLQTSLYSWGLHQIGLPVEGIMWDEMRAKPPTVPRLLKRGGLSRAKRIDTDYHTYLRTLKKNKLDPAPYKSFLKKLKFSKKHAFYRRQTFPFKEEVVRRIVKDAKRTAREICRDMNNPVRELGFMCRFCDYKGLCLAELNGNDIEFMVKADFKKRSRRNN